MRVFLDDERPTPAGWTRAYTPGEVISMLRTGNVREVSLDHDLGDDTKGTGNDVILWVEEAVVTAGFKPPVIHVHSANSSARLKMEAGARQIHVLYNRFATKSESEKADEKVQELVKPTPTKKPPRHDLRRHRVKTEDPDTVKPGADSDKDLSLNYKRVAATLLSNRYLKRAIENQADEHLASLVRTSASKVLKDKKPKDKGDFWQNNSGGWSAKNQDEVTTGFTGDGAEESAKAWADGTGKGKGQKEEDPEKQKKREEQEAKKKEQEAKRKEQEAKKEQLQKTLSSINTVVSDVIGTTLDPKLAKELSTWLSVQDSSFQNSMAKSFRNALKESMTALGKTDGEIPSEMVEKAAYALDNKKDLGAHKDDPHALGSSLADYLFASRVLANPRMVGGVSVKGLKLTPQQLNNRAVQSFQQYNSMNNALRQEAMDQIVEQQKKFNRYSPAYEELKSIENGLVMSAMLFGQETKTSSGRELRPSIAPGFRTLLQNAHAVGKAELLIKGGDDLFGPTGQNTIREMQHNMTDDELVDVAAGENSNYRELGELLQSKKLPDKYNAFLRDLLTDVTVDDMTTNQALMNAFSKKKADKKPQEAGSMEQDQVRERVKEDVKRDKAFKEFLNCVTSGDTEKCKELGDQARVLNLAAHVEAAEAVYGTKPDKSDPALVKVEQAIEQKDLSLLNGVWIQQGEKPPRSPFTPGKSDRTRSILEKKREWLQHVTDPKERERIRLMSPDEFEQMVAAIMDEEEEEDLDDPKNT